MNTDVMFSSKSSEWETPQWLFDRLDSLFHFELDVCASDSTAKCQQYFSVKEDGLKQEWRGSCWMNPPYGREIGRWVEKAYLSSLDEGATVVCLLPARTDTLWWHKYCSKGEVYFLKGRLKFSNSKTSAPFPSAIVVFRKSVKDVLDCVSL